METLSDNFKIVTIEPDQTHSLRREVLGWQNVTSMKDTLCGVAHFACLTPEGESLAVGSVGPVEFPNFPDIDASQFWGIAVGEDMQGQGLGQLVMEQIIDRSLRQKREILWACARPTALRFYSRLGFVITDDVRIDRNISVPNQLIYMPLNSSIVI